MRLSAVQPTCSELPRNQRESQVYSGVLLSSQKPGGVSLAGHVSLSAPDSPPGHVSLSVIGDELDSPESDPLVGNQPPQTSSVKAKLRLDDIPRLTPADPEEPSSADHLSARVEGPSVSHTQVNLPASATQAATASQGSAAHQGMSAQRVTKTDDVAAPPVPFIQDVEPEEIKLKPVERAFSRNSLSKDTPSSSDLTKPSPKPQQLPRLQSKQGSTTTWSAVPEKIQGPQLAAGELLPLNKSSTDETSSETQPSSPFASSAQTVNNGWREGEYGHVAINETLRDIVQDFGRGQGIATFVSQKINITVNGVYKPAPPEQFLNQLASDNGLTWFESNNRIFVHRMEEILDRIVVLNHIDANTVIQAIQELDLGSPQLPIRASNHHLLRIQGPEHYLQSIETLIASMDLPQPDDPGDKRLILKVFRLKFALADDYSFAAGSTQSVIPGVATVLRNLIVDRDSQVAGGIQTNQVPYARPSLLGRGLISAGEPDNPAKKPILPNLGLVGGMSGEQRELTAKASPTSDTYIQAEPRLNAVIIRDTRENLDLYGEIIAAIDVPNGMVQITASIVDVDTRNDFRWTPPGRLSWSESGNTTSLNWKITPTLPNPNVVFNLISNDEMLGFLAQVQYLEENGQARVQSRPSVVTLSNTPAILSSTETFFVRVAGAYQSDLFNVDVGTRLQVVPHLIDENGQNKIKLLLQINDGKVLDTDVDGVPRVRRSNISTQAVLLENESLLVGGMYRTEFIDNEQMVPKIGRVPVIGKLFRSFERNHREYQRLIVVTPRRVNAMDIMPTQQIPYAGDLLSADPCPPPADSAPQPATQQPVPVLEPPPAPAVEPPPAPLQ